jgi:hypothetical protein
MKILEFKRSGTGLIVEFRGIPNGFPNQAGDQSKFSLNCLRCGKKTPTELIGKVLFMAPMAISHHLKILSSIPSVNDSC